MKLIFLIVLPCPNYCEKMQLYIHGSLGDVFMPVLMYNSPICHR